MGYSSVRADRPTSNSTSAPPKSTASVQKKGPFNHFVATMGKWFELDPEFGRIPKNRTFRNAGMALNALSAILIGFLAQPPSGWLMFWGALYSLVFFNLCIRFVNVKLALV